MSPFRLLTSCGLCAALCLRADNAPPDPADPPIRLDPVAVDAAPERTLTLPDLALAREDAARVPGGAEVIASDRFLRGRVGPLEDTFALSPGVVAQSRFGADEARLSIRGSGLQRTFHGRGLRILQDGVPLNLADGSFDMQAIEPLAAAHVAVHRGGNAFRQGASTLGGAIDYVSHSGFDSGPGRARLEFGSWGYQRAAVSAGSRHGPADGFAVLTHHAQDGFRDHARQSSQRVFAHAGWRWHDDLETRVAVTGVITDSELPGNLTRAQIVDDPRQAAAGNVALRQKRDYTLGRIATRTTARRGDARWDLLAAWTAKSLDHPIFQVIDQASDDLLLGLRCDLPCPLAPADARLRGGVLWTHGTIDAANFENRGGHRGPRLTAAQQRATNLETFVDVEVPLQPGWSLLAGVAATVSWRENQPVFGPTVAYDLRYDRLLPRLGLLWQRRDWQVFANLTGSFEPPSFSEALTVGSARAAQTAETIELGTRGAAGPVRWDLVVYDAAIRGELLALDHDQNPATPAATVNADRTRHSGVEAGLEADLLGAPCEVNPPRHRLVARVAWTYGRFRFDDDARYERNVLPGLPPHLVRGELTWQHARGWYAGPVCEWVPEKVFIDFRNTFSAPPHTLIGFRFGCRRPVGLSWFIEGRNLADRHSVATTGVIENAGGVDQPQFLPGDGRSVFGGIEYAW